MSGSFRPHRALLILGFLYLAAGVRFGRWAFTAVRSGDSVENIFGRVAGVFGILLIGWGLVTIVERERTLILNINILLVMVLFLSPPAGEILLRVGIALGVERLRQPSLYTDYFSDEDYWILFRRWDNRWRDSQTNDSLLGWSHAATSENSLGILAATQPSPDFDGPVVLFYGNSYVAGATTEAARIPQQLGRFLPDSEVYNYGVGGYGIDQIYLRLRGSVVLFTQPVLIFGILTEDIDRAVLKYRLAPKPYFVLAGGSLELRGVPVTQSPDEWIAHHPLRIRSYLLSFLRQQFRVLTATRGYASELSFRRVEKQELGRAILAATVRESARRRMPLLFVIFYTEAELHFTGWREQFLHQQFTQLGVPYIDTKPILLAAARKELVPVSEYYFPPTTPGQGHHNERGNHVIAQAIADFLQQHAPARFGQGQAMGAKLP